MKWIFRLTLILFTLFSVSNAQADTIYRNISVIQADSLILAHPADTNFVILDVRQLGPYDSGHIQNAINIDFYDANFSSLINALDHDKIYLVYCQSGGRSGATFAMMQTQHFREVYNMLSGMNAWLGAGYPVVSTSQINENYVELNSRIYPNPFIDKAIIDIRGMNIMNGKIEIFNVSGQKIKELIFNSDIIEISGSSFSKGLYFYVLTDNNKRIITGNFEKN